DGPPVGEEHRTDRPLFLGDDGPPRLELVEELPHALQDVDEREARPDDRGALEEALEALDGAEDADALERIAAVALRHHHERLAAAEGALHGAVAPVVLGAGGQDARRRARIADLHAR